jgi:hypothetical protein
MAKQNNNTAPDVKLLVEAQKLAKQLGLDYERLVDIQADIINGQVRNVQQLKESVKYALEDTIIQRAKQKEAEKQLKTKAKIAKLEEDVLDIAHSLQKPLSKIGKMTKETYEQDMSRITAARRLKLITQEQSAEYEKQLKRLQQISDNPKTKAGFEAVGNAADGIGNKLDGAFDKMPGGKQIQKMLGLDDISGKIQKEVITNGFSKIGPSLAKGGVIAILLLAFEVLQAITAEAKEFALQTGVTFTQARKIADESREAAQSLNVQLATSKDILAVQQSTIAEFGTMAMMSTETAAQVADIGKSFGYGADQAAQVNNQFMSMGVAAEDAAGMQQEVAFSALKAGVNVGTVMKDITANAKTTAKYFGGNVKALTAAAVEAAKMGVSLATMSKVADKLLDLESSLTSQMEFQALAGRTINLDTARQLALEGDIAGATKQVLEQVGGIEEFNNMSYRARLKLAEATGMEVDELQRSLTIQGKLSSLTDDEKAKLTGMNISAEKLADMTAEQARAELAKQQGLEKAEASMSALKDQLMTALIPLAEALGSIFSAIAPILKLIGYLFIPMQVSLKVIGNLIQKVIERPMERISTFFSGIGDLFSGNFQSGLKKIGESVLGLVLSPIQLVVDTIMSVVDGVIWLLNKIPGVNIDKIGDVDLAKTIMGTGDLAVGANGGPIVASPTEGKIFQGTKNDEVAMGPGVIDAAKGAMSSNPREGTILQGTKNDEVAMGPGIIDAAKVAISSMPIVGDMFDALFGAPATESDAALIQETNNLLRQLIEAAKTPAPVQIGSAAIEQIGKQAAARKSYR